MEVSQVRRPVPSRNPDNKLSVSRSRSVDSWLAFRRWHKLFIVARRRTVHVHICRAVLTNGPPGFFFFRGAPTGCGEILFLKLIILLLMLLRDRTNTSSAYLVNLHTVVHGLFCAALG